MQKYTLIKSIGEGTFSNVYKGINNRTAQPVAIKCAHKRDETNVKLLIREAKMYNYLKNTPGIPTLLWVGTYDMVYYIVMPLYVGTLKTYNAGDMGKLYSVGIKLLEIVKWMHSKCVIHRDIKPDNIMYDVTETLHIIDLGMCKITTSKYIPSSISGVIGSPNYISVGVHTLINPHMKDDTEAVMYVLLYIWLGNTLPWTHQMCLDDVKKSKEDLRTTDQKYPRMIVDYLCINDENPRENIPSYILTI
jgi:serine/threonine protein kinase